MLDLDQLDGEVGGPMRVLERDAIVVVPAATEFSWQVVRDAVTRTHVFATKVWPIDAELTAWRVPFAQQGWVRHNGLVAGNQAARLVQMMEKYGDGIEYDLRHHLDVSAGQLWRARRWRELLGYIDQLPTDTHKNRLMTSDEEHMEALVRASKGKASGPGNPSMSDWGQLESMIAVLIDAVNRNTEVTHAVSTGKKAKPLKLGNYPRPATAVEKIEKRIQKDEHEAMVALLLPAKREEQVS